MTLLDPFYLIQRFFEKNNLVGGKKEVNSIALASKSFDEAEAETSVILVRNDQTVAVVLEGM